MAAAVVPYAAVAAGLFALGSAWAAILLYHLGIVVVLSITGWRAPVVRAQSGGSWFALPASAWSYFLRPRSWASNSSTQTAAAFESP